MQHGDLSFPQFPHVQESSAMAPPSDGLIAIQPELSLKLAEFALSGSVFSVITVTPNLAMASLAGEQLEPMVYDPNDIEDSKILAIDRRLRDAAPLRAQVQRLFEKAKKDNAQRYSTYIEDVEMHGRYGFMPPINLWTPEPLETVGIGIGGIGFMAVPRDRILIPFEGETQLAARFQAWDRNPEMRKHRVPVMIAHGLPVIWAQQSFHDVNVYGIKPNAALAIAMDNYDAATMIARKLESEVAFLGGKVNKSRRQLRKIDRKAGQIMTITALRSSVATIARGISGVAYGTRTVPIDDAEIEKVHRWAASWWNALGAHLGSELADGESMASSPAVIAALGAVGHDVLSSGGSADDAADRLAREVKWAKGDRWAGIGGKFTDKGAFSVGGAKEYAHLIHKALTDPTTGGYAKIRA
jgi:DNA sulfur modification protein DndB